MSAFAEAPFQLSEQPREAELLAKYFRGLGEVTRLRILEALMKGERSVGELVELLGEPQPKVSSHLGCLRWCGFVESRREYRTVYYRIADPRVGRMIELARALLEDNAEHVAACRRIDGGPGERGGSRPPSQRADPLRPRRRPAGLDRLL